MKITCGYFQLYTWKSVSLYPQQKNKNCSVTGIVDNNRPLSFGYLYGWGTNVLFTNTVFMINELQLTATEVQLFYSNHKKSETPWSINYFKTSKFDWTPNDIRIEKIILAPN